MDCRDPHMRTRFQFNGVCGYVGVIATRYVTPLTTWPLLWMRPASLRVVAQTGHPGRPFAP